MAAEHPQAKHDSSQAAPADAAGGDAGARADGASASSSAPAPGAAAPKPAAAPGSAQRATVGDEFDPLGWDVPVICKDCNKRFIVPYRNFHAGVVFHCPSCQGSWVPNSTIAQGMRKVLEGFWGPRKLAREAFESAQFKLDRGEFERRQAQELKAFEERLERLATELKPAGKLVRPKGLAAMFT
jgi:hypothetical protein